MFSVYDYQGDNWKWKLCGKLGNVMVISATSKSGIWLSQDVAKSKAGFENMLVTWIFGMHVKAKEKSNYGIVHKKWWISIVWFS